MLNDLSPAAQVGDPAHRLDKPATLDRIGRLALLPRGWNGHDAGPIDPGVIEAASRLVDLLPPDAIEAPQVVPMTRGRLQWEWHRGNRSLELEFETPTLIRYLKYDPDREIEEEAALPIGDLPRVVELLRWFHEG